MSRPKTEHTKLGIGAKCKDCGYSWHSLSKAPQCPRCKSRHLQINDDLKHVIPYFLGRILWKLDAIDWRLGALEKKLKGAKK